VQEEEGVWTRGRSSKRSAATQPSRKKPRRAGKVAVKEIDSLEQESEVGVPDLESPITHIDTRSSPNQLQTPTKVMKTTQLPPTPSSSSRQTSLVAPALDSGPDSDSDEGIATSLIPVAPSLSPRSRGQHLRFENLSAGNKRTRFESTTPPTPVATPTREVKLMSPETDLAEEEADKEIVKSKLDKGKGRAEEVEEADDTVMEEMEEELEEGEDEEEEEEEEEDQSDDELDCLSTPKKSTRHSLSTPVASSSKKPLGPFTPSLRNRGLPAERVIPTKSSDLSNLRQDLVGYASESGGEDDEDITTAETRQDPTLSTTNSAQRFATSIFLQHFSHIGAVLTGSRQPSTKSVLYDITDVMAYPVIETLSKWEKKVRVAAEGVVARGVGTCVVLVGQRGVGKSLVCRCL
jgi:hypothetical protein